MSLLDGLTLDWKTLTVAGDAAAGLKVARGLDRTESEWFRDGVVTIRQDLRMALIGASLAPLKPLVRREGAAMRNARIAAATVGALSLALMSAGSAQAAPRCEGPTIKSATVVDQGQLGILDPGDVIRLDFARPIAPVDYAGFSFALLGADGTTASQSDPGGETALTFTSKSITIGINQLQISGTPNEIALPLPATITAITGVYSQKKNFSGAPVSLTCSKDVVLS